MRALLPYLALYKRHFWLLLLGVIRDCHIAGQHRPADLVRLVFICVSRSAQPDSTALIICSRLRESAEQRLHVLPGAILSGWSVMTRLSACCNICV